MTTLLTLVAQETLDDTLLTACAALDGHRSTEKTAPHVADILYETAPTKDAIAELTAPVQTDFALQPAATRAKKLLIADMDSTMIQQECLDELAAAVGIGEEIAAITERAMRGELNFEAALTERVARLNGVDEKICQDVIRDRLDLSAGAKELITSLNDAGLRTVLVSGGFDVFVREIAAQCGFVAWHANQLDVVDGKLTGKVVPPILGREAKAQFLADEAEIAGASLEEAVAMGDGANDLGMIEAAGLGVAYKAKPIVASSAEARIEFTDLRTVLHFVGL